jgi:hypothetical protein
MGVDSVEVAFIMITLIKLLPAAKLAAEQMALQS